MVVGDKWEPFCQYVQIMSRKEALDKCGLQSERRYCCRRMILTHVDMTDNLLDYSKDSDLSEHPFIKEKTKTVEVRVYSAR